MQQELHHITSRKVRMTKLTGIALGSLFVLGFFGMAAIYVWTLTHPGCSIGIQPPANLPQPEEVWLENLHGQRLRAWYYPPQNKAAILAAGAGTGSLGDNLPPVSFLIVHGYGILQIDQRNCANPASPVTMGMEEFQDIEAGLAYLNTKTDVKRIGIFGFSMGGVTAIRTAARNPEIVAVLAEGGYHNMGDNIIKPDKHKSVFENAFLYTIAGMLWIYSGVNPWQVSPVDDLATISPRPVFLIYGEHEAESGHARAQYDAALPPKQLWTVPGGNHGSNYLVAPEIYEAKILDFFNRTLLP